MPVTLKRIWRRLHTKRRRIKSFGIGVGSLPDFYDVIVRAPLMFCCVEEDSQSTKTSVGGPVCLLLQAATGVNQKRKSWPERFLPFLVVFKAHTN